MKKLQLATMAVALVVAVQARATLYDITFTQTGEGSAYANGAPLIPTTDAIGQINVVGGVALSGNLDVLTGPDSGIYTLVAGSGTSGGGSGFQYDNIVYTGGGPFLDSTAGLLWSVTGLPDSSAQLNMWYNTSTQYGQPASTYSLWGFPPAYNLQAYGTGTISAVPEPTTMLSGALLLLPLGASTLRILRKSRMA